MTGEETGLVGTRRYIDHPPLPLDQMAANINAAGDAVRLLTDGTKPEWKPDGRPCRQGEQPRPGVCS